MLSSVLTPTGTLPTARRTASHAARNVIGVQALLQIGAANVEVDGASPGANGRGGRPRQRRPA